jgi:hypothetical protein
LTGLFGAVALLAVVASGLILRPEYAKKSSSSVSSAAQTIDTDESPVPAPASAAPPAAPSAEAPAALPAPAESAAEASEPAQAEAMPHRRHKGTKLTPEQRELRRLEKRHDGAGSHTAR